MPELKLTDLVTAIDNDKLVIPDFQRGFKWKQSDIRKLLESLLLDFPIGAALFWKTERKTLEFRRVEAVEFLEDDESSENGDAREQDKNGTEEIDFILDGQQRITSIYKLFPASLAPTDRELESNLKGLRFFLDLTKLGLNTEVLTADEKSLNSLTDPDNVAAAIVEKRAPDLRKEYRSISTPVPQRLTEDHILEICTKHSWLPLTRSFLENKQAHVQRIRRAAAAKLPANNAEQEKKIEIALDRWVDWFASTFQATLNRKSLMCLILGNDKPEGLARIFETINSTGMNLSVFDLLVARLGTWQSAGKDINLRKLLSEGLSKELLQKFDDDRSLGGTASQQVPRILALRAGIDLRKGDILKTKKETFLKEVEFLAPGLKTALDTLMQHMGVIDQSYVPAKDAISLIAAVHSKDWDRQKDSVIAFLWAICLIVDWDSSTNEKAKQSFIQLKDLLSGKLNTKELLQRLENEFPTFDEVRDSTSKSAIIFRTFMTFNLARGGEDWLGKPRNTGVKLEDHHIFPKDWINNNRAPKEDKAAWNSVRDSVLNRIFVSEEANDDAKAKTPPTYLSKLTKAERRTLQIPESFIEPLTTPITLDAFTNLLKQRYDLLKADFLESVEAGLSV